MLRTNLTSLMRTSAAHLKSSDTRPCYHTPPILQRSSFQHSEQPGITQENPATQKWTSAATEIAKFCMCSSSNRQPNDDQSKPFIRYCKESRVTLEERKAPDASNDPPVSISSASTVLHSGNASVTQHGTVQPVITHGVTTCPSY